MSQQVNTRGIILDILLEINEKERFTHEVLSEALRKYQYLSKEDRAFISYVVRGTVEYRITLDYIIEKFSDNPIGKMKPVIRNIIRMSAYQIMFMDNVKDYAVCDEAVKLTVKKGYDFFKSFVNAVLRNIARTRKENYLPECNCESNNKKIRDYLSIAYSMPKWLVSMWISRFGREQTENMLKAQFVKRPLTIRCNTARITPKELAKRLTDRGITVREMILPEALEISGYDYLEKIPEFIEGLFFVQDISSMLVAHIAAPEKDSRIIDLCAAPGGKSMHLAEMMAGNGYVDARDVSDAKAVKIQENIKRLGLNNVSVKVHDARITDEEVIDSADIVIADLPCSGLGVLAGKPDIKYHATYEGCEKLAMLQREILAASAGYVKKGGVLIYSTCTVNHKENIDNVRWFIDEYPFELESLDSYIPKVFHSETTKDGYIQLLPGNGINTSENNEENYDGFFIARLVRK